MSSFFRSLLNNKHVCNCSYSQEGEDVLLTRIIGDINYHGSFIDIGAHHPVKFSNTYKFYLAGWRGINIDATPGSINAFNKLRPFDINIEQSISDREEEIIFYIFNHPELNTFSKANLLEWNGKGNVRLIKEKKMLTTTLDKVLAKNIPDKRVFDLLSIDVEGFDLKILKSIDLGKFKFKFIITEDQVKDISKIMEGEMYRFLISNGYKLISKLYYSSIYQLDEK